MLVLLIVEIEDQGIVVSSRSVMVVLQFHDIRSTDSKIERGNFRSVISSFLQRKS
jgi:hypothetical protein